MPRQGIYPYEIVYGPEGNDQNRPYFAPGANVTWDQRSKIVVGAAGWAPAVTTQHFTNVPPVAPFFAAIETAYAHGIINGYGDGTFQPGTNATRGQIAKIVAGAVTGPQRGGVVSDGAP